MAAFPERFAQPHLADIFAVLADAQMETLIGWLRHGDEAGTITAVRIRSKAASVPPPPPTPRLPSATTV